VVVSLYPISWHGWDSVQELDGARALDFARLQEATYALLDHHADSSPPEELALDRGEGITWFRPGSAEFGAWVSSINTSWSGFSSKFLPAASAIGFSPPTLLLRSGLAGAANPARFWFSMDRATPAAALTIRVDAEQLSDLFGLFAEHDHDVEGVQTTLQVDHTHQAEVRFSAVKDHTHVPTPTTWTNLSTTSYDELGNSFSGDKHRHPRNAFGAGNKSSELAGWHTHKIRSFAWNLVGFDEDHRHKLTRTLLVGKGGKHRHDVLTFAVTSTPSSSKTQLAVPSRTAVSWVLTKPGGAVVGPTTFPAGSWPYDLVLDSHLTAVDGGPYQLELRLAAGQNDFAAPLMAFGRGA